MDKSFQKTTVIPRYFTKCLITCFACNIYITHADELCSISANTRVLTIEIYAHRIQVNFSAFTYRSVSYGHSSPPQNKNGID